MTTSIRILILEDSPEDAELMTLQLRQSGLTPSWVRVESESEFLAQLPYSFDAILADHNMPQFNAQRALQLLQERNLDIPFIIVSGYISEEVAVECMKQGAADYLLKDRLARLGPALQAALLAKQMRDEKRKAEAQLRESEARFRRLAENALDVIYCYRLAPTRGLEYVSPAVTAMTGYAAQELYADADFFLNIVHPDDRGLLEKAMGSENPAGAIVVRCVCKDGTLRWMETRCLPVYDETGKQLAVEGILRDVSARLRAEEALQKAVEERTAQLKLLNEQLLSEMQEREIAQKALAERFNQLQTVYQLAEAIGRAAAIEEIYQAALNGIEHSLKAECAGILLFDEDGILRCQTGRGLSDTCRKAIEKHFASGVEISQQPLAIADVETAVEREYLGALQTVLLREGIRALGLIPLGFQGRLLGLFMLGYSTPRQFSAEAVQLAVAIASHIAFACDRQRSDVALRASEERFRRIFDEASIGMSLLGLDYRFFKVNRAFCEMLGYSEAELASLTFADITHSQDLKQEMSFIGQAIRGEIDSFQLEKRYLARNGEILWANLTWTAMRDPAGKFLYGVGMVEDISDRKRAEEALRSSEEQFRQLAENIRQVLWIASPDNSQVMYLSPAYEEIWGRSCLSAYERAQSWLETIHPEDRDAAIALNELLLQGEAVKNEFRILLPDGSIRWIWNRAFPIRNESGEVYRIAGIAEDITERKHSEVELRKALETERELNELKSRFVSMVSHEFRNPLTTILMSVELLEHFGDRVGDDKKRRYLDRIKAAARQMTDLLENVLLVGKAEAGKLSFTAAPMDLDAFCRDLVEEMQMSAGYLHVITFVRRGKNTADSRKIPTLHSLPCLDEKLLWHILSNLLSNAIKYSPGGGTVQLTLAYFEREVAFEIADEGIGIPPDDRLRLFDSFHRAANVGKIPGTGLGLAIVKKAVDLHGGTISVSSEVGVGTTFTVKLPVHYSADD